VTPEQRRMRASIAAHTRWANTADRAAAMEPARRGFADKLEHEADPEGVLSPRERAIRAENLRKAFYKRMALKSSKARAWKREMA
jgi:hypothetical protein